MSSPAQTPVLVGIGLATRHEEDFTRALEPMDLMLEAVRNAGADTSVEATLRGVQHIAVPRGRWKYANPAGEIGRAVGADKPLTVLASVGVLQQSLLGEACGRIARGEAHTTLVTGADAGYRLLRAQIAGQVAPERVQEDAPDVYLSPKDELRHPVEKRAGLLMPVGLYAILESANRARRGWGVDEHRDQIARLGERFNRIATENPHAWVRRRITAAEIRDASDRNPMQAFPYTRFHCSTWNVDQAAALLFCSVERAEQLGIPRSRWVFPLASTESNNMVPVSARARLDQCIGARIAGQVALEASGLRADAIDLVELYSCFPFAVQTYADALGLSLERDLTVTGGMAFGGGPYNNYTLQATCRAAELLRQGKGRTALVSNVSGVVTKQAFGIWSTEPGPGFVQADVSEQVARETETRTVVEDYTGPSTVAGYTVLHGRNQPSKGILLVDTPQGQRAMATTEDAGLIDALQRDEFVGRPMRIESNQACA